MFTLLAISEPALAKPGHGANKDRPHHGQSAKHSPSSKHKHKPSPKRKHKPSPKYKPRHSRYHHKRLPSHARYIQIGKLRYVIVDGHYYQRRGDNYINIIIK